VGAPCEYFAPNGSVSTPLDRGTRRQVDDQSAAAVPDLVVDVRHDGGAAIVSMAGELDVSTAPELVDICRSVYAQGTRDVVLDLTDTSFLDSSGLRALIGAQQLFGDDGGNVRLSHPSEPVMRLLEITGLSAYFSIENAPAR
jgi:anti-sigma B factor antagonist